MSSFLSSVIFIDNMTAILSPESALVEFCKEAAHQRYFGFMTKKPEPWEQQAADRWIASQGLHPRQVELRGRYIVGRHRERYGPDFYEDTAGVTDTMGDLRVVARVTFDRVDPQRTLGYRLEHYHPIAYQVAYRELVHGSGTIQFIHPRQYDRLMIRTWRVQDSQQ